MLIFGKKEKGVRYTWRPGVYGIIFNEQKDRIALMQTDDGKYFLPGGGLENGESHHDCLLRESIEEMGMFIKLGVYIGEAQRYFYSTKDHEYYLVVGYFYFGELAGYAGKPTETDHHLKWVEPELAVVCLFQEHQKWAVGKSLTMLCK